jgi:hypothetical protein
MPVQRSWDDADRSLAADVFKEGRYNATWKRNSDYNGTRPFH